MDKFAYFNSILHFTQASLNLENHRVFRCVRYEVDRLTIYALDIPVILSLSSDLLPISNKMVHPDVRISQERQIDEIPFADSSLLSP